MKAWIACILPMVIAACGAAQRRDAPMPSQEDQQALFTEIEAFARAWSRGDAKEAASFYTEDGVRVGAAGDVQHGREELKSAYEKLLHGPFAGAKVTLERGSVRGLTPDLALWQGGMEIVPAGSKSPIKGYVVQVMKTEYGPLLVLAVHLKPFPLP